MAAPSVESQEAVLLGKQPRAWLQRGSLYYCILSAHCCRRSIHKLLRKPLRTELSATGALTSF